MSLITSEIARDYAARATAARKKNKQDRIDRIKILEKALLTAPTPPAPPPAPPIDDVVSERLMIVREQISGVRILLNSTDDHYCAECSRGGVDGKTRAMLMKALDTMLDRERILLGTPLPGNRRPAVEKKRGSTIMVSDISSEV